MAKALEPIREESTGALFLHNRSDSPLLRLPGEIRNCIFEFAFTVKRVIVDRDLLDSQHPTRIFINTVNAQEVQDGLFTMLYPISTGCRQIYEETEALPFTLNTLEICLEDIEALVQFLPFHIRGLITELKIQICNGLGLAQIHSNSQFSAVLPLSSHRYKAYTYLDTRALYDEAAGNRRLAAVAQFPNLRQITFIALNQARALPDETLIEARMQFKLYGVKEIVVTEALIPQKLD